MKHHPHKKLRLNRMAFRTDPDFLYATLMVKVLMEG